MIYDIHWSWKTSATISSNMASVLFSLFSPGILIKHMLASLYPVYHLTTLFSTFLSLHVNIGYFLLTYLPVY